MKKKTGVMVSTIVLSVLFMCQTAFPWGSAVHTYINDQFATKWKIRNANQLYGGMGPDVFNYRFDEPEYMQFMYSKTHYDFMDVWNIAKSLPEKALAFGFVSHNYEDFTAHTSGLTFGQGVGYVKAKAVLVDAALASGSPTIYAVLPGPVREEISHILVETGVDILLKNVDSLVGDKMVSAVRPPNPNFPRILVKAYGNDLAQSYNIKKQQAASFITSSEKQFRSTVILYGIALMQDEAMAIELIAGQLAEFAKSFLAANGITPPPDEILTLLASSGIQYAMYFCADDFVAEINATTNYVGEQLTANGIAY